MTKTTRLAAAAGLAALGPLASAAAAQTGGNCAPRAALVERLETRFGETRQSIGLGSDNSVMEVYASTDTGTWTILLTMPSGVSCLIAAGQAFENLTPGATASGSDA